MKLEHQATKQIPSHTVTRVRQLAALLECFPKDAKVYIDYAGHLVIREGKKELAKVNVSGV